ncbi:MAG: hypothetical protein MPJ50_09425 [Pirellulales bacterium]|nr:hypothetical protein [Pirellulales bacterium]
MLKWKLSALRLVGFHNYEDELIEVSGDLFVVGINESGKTTILDALHLVLSGGMHWDLNAAAKMAGRGSEGRSINGIILRANLAGVPARSGGSIMYSAAEFVSTTGDRTMTLLLGASVADMKARPSYWGLICSEHACDLPLVQDNGNGSSRIVGRDELQQLIKTDLQRSREAYRKAVVDRLFEDRDDFENVTELWQRAKSYKELVKTTSNIGDLFRRVLPEPDAEPFDKVAKGFQDISSIEETLIELAEDVTALTALDQTCTDAQDARETRRRYEYISAKFDVDSASQQLHEAQQNKANAESQRDQLESKINRLTQRSQSLQEQLATLRASDTHSKAAKIAELKTEIDGLRSKLSEKNRQLSEQRGRLDDENQKLTKLQSDTQQVLDTADNQLRKLSASLRPYCSKFADEVVTVASLLPRAIDDVLKADELRSGVETLRSNGNSNLERAKGRLITVTTDLADVDDRLGEVSVQLERLKSHPDLVAPVEQIEEILESLRSHEIDYRFLFQEIEFSNSINDSKAAAVETAMGMTALSTLIVDPSDVDRAREIVFEFGSGLRVLDSAPVRPEPEEMSDDARDDGFQLSGAATGEAHADDDDGESIASVLEAGDPRVRAHLDAVFTDVELEDKQVGEGENRHWIDDEGLHGERGARGRTELASAQWIGEQRRTEIRQNRLAELDREQSELKAETKRLGKLSESLDAEITSTEAFIRELNQLGIPSKLEVLWTQIQAARDAAAQYQRAVTGFENEVDGLQTEQQSKQATRDTLAGQVNQADVDALLQQIGTLESTHSITNQELGSARTSRDGQVDAVKRFEQEIPELDDQLRESEISFGVQRDSLSAVIPPEVSDVDHYVFTTKRGSQIQLDNLAPRLRDAIVDESTKKTRLESSDGVLQNRFATKYRFQVVDEGGRISVSDYRGDTLAQILQQRQQEEEEWRSSLDKNRLNLIQNVLAQDLISRLQDDLLTLERTVRGLNSVLADLQFGHQHFQLTFTPTDEHKQFIKLVQRQSLLNEAEQTELLHHLENRQESLAGEGEVPPFLDYRNWFDFQFQAKSIKSDDALSIGRAELVKGSGGAQVTHNYLLLFALASFQFDQTKSKLRILMMDEAFPDLSLDRKELLLRCAKKLRLDLVIASPDVDGTFLGDGYDTTSLLVERDEDDNVAIATLVWEKAESQGDLFAEPRPAAIFGNAGDEHE